MKLKYSSWLLVLIIALNYGVSLLTTSNNPSRTVLSVQQKSTLQPREAPSKVVKVVDGDTIDVIVDSKKVRVRVIGINTPETVDPRRPVECFGKEASEKAKNILLDKTVKLVSDTTQDDRDKYGRLLRYVFLPDGTDFGLIMIQEGYAYEYTYDIPYKYQSVYKKAQKESESAKKGLWSDASCKGKK